MNNHCYNFKKIIFDNNDVLFKNIDAVYVIYLINNGRYDNIIKQLNYFKISKNNYILLNPGFKKCNKILNKQKSNADLVDCNFYILNDAYNKNYNNILILEDDFEFDEEIKNEKSINDISNFILKNTNNNIIYYIGCLPYMVLPYNFNNYTIIGSGGTHSIIYNKKTIEFILKQDRNTIYDWEVFTNLKLHRVMYYKPLCYQLCIDSENFNSYDSFYIFNINLSHYWYNFMRNMYKYFELDKNFKSYKKFYFFSKIIIYLILFIILFILFFIIRSIYYKNKLNNKKYKKYKK